MDKKTEKFYLVEKNALPEVYEKVMQVKEGIKNKTYPSVNQAVKELGISRSAYYKYRNSVFSYQGSDYDAVDVFHIIIEIDLISIQKIFAVLEKNTAQMIGFQQAPIMKGTSSILIICRKISNKDTGRILAKLKKEIGIIRVSHQAVTG